MQKRGFVVKAGETLVKIGNRRKLLPISTRKGWKFKEFTFGGSAVMIVNPTTKESFNCGIEIANALGAGPRPMRGDVAHVSGDSTTIKQVLGDQRGAGFWRVRLNSGAESLVTFYEVDDAGNRYWTNGSTLD
jgi:hypothetical protein